MLNKNIIMLGCALGATAVGGFLAYKWWTATGNKKADVSSTRPPANQHSDNALAGKDKEVDVNEKTSANSDDGGEDGGEDGDNAKKPGEAACHATKRPPFGGLKKGFLL